MDAAERHPAAPLSEARDRIEAARRLGLLPLLVLLDRLDPGAAEVGGDAPPGEERLRLRHDPALSFAAGDVARVAERTRPGSSGDAAAGARIQREITTTFLGLTGAVTPVPQYLAEEVAQDSSDDRANQDFLDLFHHRALSLLARGLLEHDLGATYRTDQGDPWSRRLLALLGVDPEATGPGAPAGPPGAGEGEGRWLLLRAAALLAERAPTAAGLAALLRDALRDELGDALLEVEQFVGVRVPIAEPDRTRLGSRASTLGRDLVVGETVLDRTSTVAVVIGPVGPAGYLRFAAERRATGKLREAVALATRGELSCVVELRLEPGAAPPLRLAAEGGARLGRNAWLGGQRRAARIRLTR